MKRFLFLFVVLFLFRTGSGQTIQDSLGLCLDKYNKSYKINYIRAGILGGAGSIYFIFAEDFSTTSGGHISEFYIKSCYAWGGLLSLLSIYATTRGTIYLIKRHKTQKRIKLTGEGLILAF